VRSAVDSIDRYAWSVCQANCPEDVNGDGSINVLDLIDLLLLFGTTCP